MKLLILNGPNLNLLGKREPEVYGDITFDVYCKKLQEKYVQIQLDYFQSNIEGEIIDKLHEVGFEYDGILLNAGAYTHTSVAIGDAVRAIESPVIEVHISNVYAREEYRHHSYVSPNAAGIIIGMGLTGYDLALQYFVAQ